MINILIILGTSRKKNYSQYVAKFIHKQATSFDGIRSSFLNNASFKFNLSDEADGSKYPKLTAQIAKADGFVLVVPEYHHGYPATIKFILDLNLKEYSHKPVAVVGVSAYKYGGARMIENLLPVLRELKLITSFSDLNVFRVQKEIQNGKFVDLEFWQKKTQRMLGELKWMAQVFKDKRKKLDL